MSNHAGINPVTFPNNLTAPEAGQFVTGASVQQVAISAANQDKYLYDKFNGVAYTDIRVSFNGRKRIRRVRVTLADASQTVRVSQGDRFHLPDPAALRTITLDHTLDTPENGEVLEFVAPAISGGGEQYRFQREDATVVASFYGATTATENPCYHAEFERVGGVWRLGANSGIAWDGANYGVVPGVGA